jgi:hypothetical protein
MLQKICEDKNVMAKEKGLEVLLVYFDRCEHPKRSIPAIVSSVVESLGGRPKTQALSQELLLLMGETDQPEPVIVCASTLSYHS